MSLCGCCLETLYSVQTRQDTDQIIDQKEGLARGASRTSRAFRVDGHSVLRIAGTSDQDFSIIIEGTNDCGNGTFRQVARFDSIADANGDQFIDARFPPNMDLVRVVELGPLIAVLAPTEYHAVVRAQPIGCCEGGGWAGVGSASGPGTTVVTKADIAVGAAVETGLIDSTNIPNGTRRITLKNVGANPIRIKRTGEGGGAGRGLELAAGQTMSIGTRGGAVDLLDGFSTLGTTVAFFFERD